jgi:spore coat polysaccharide biosynthesis protein SpsF
VSVAVVVQARMTSTRLPGKVLMDLGGRPLLERQVERLARCREADEIVIACTTNDADDGLVDLARRLGLRWFRGSEDDVLSRYVGAAREAGADMVVRVTSDCPLIDPDETDRVIAALRQRRATCDYASNIQERVLPRGLDTEALWRDVLERAGRMATSASAREHVTPFIHRERRELFVVHGVRGEVEAPDLRWTVDQPEDLAMVRALWDAAGLGERYLGAAELVAFVREHPEIAAINAGVEQKREV